MADATDDLKVQIRIGADTRAAEVAFRGIVNLANRSAQQITAQIRAGFSGQDVPPPDFAQFEAEVKRVFDELERLEQEVETDPIVIPPPDTKPAEEAVKRAARTTQQATASMQGGATRLLDAFSRRALGVGVIGFGIVQGLQVIERGLDATIGRAIAWEEQMVSVRKTTGLTGASLDQLSDGLLTMAARLGIAQEGLAGIAETAGQLGIEGVAPILTFTETVAKLADVSDLSESQAAEEIAKIANAFDLPIEKSNELGSVINELSNTTTARAGDITNALTRIGPAGQEIGLAVPEVAGLAATLIDTGIAAQTSGRGIRNVFIRMRTEAVDMAETAGLSLQEYNRMLEEDALGALNAYLEGLRALPDELRAIEIKDIFGEENFLAVAALAQQTELLTTNVTTAQTAFAEGTSLNLEFAASLDSVSKQWDIFTANLTRVVTGMGNSALPTLERMLRAINAMSRDATALREEIDRLNGEVANTRAIDRLIDRYERLTERGLERTAEETAELKRVTDELASAYPDYISQTDAAGNAVAIYADNLRGAVAAQRELARATALANLGDLAGQYEAAADGAERARQRQAEYDVLATDSAARQEENERRVRDAVRQRTEAINLALVSEEKAREELAKAGGQAAQYEAELRVATLQLGELFTLSSGSFDRRGFIDQLVANGRDLEEAGRIATEVRFRYAALRAEVEAIQQVRPEDDETPEIPTTPTDPEEAAAAAERALAATERLFQASRQLAAEAIQEETERRLTMLDLAFDAEVQNIERTAQAALQAQGLTEEQRADIREQERQALESLGEIRQRRGNELAQAEQQALEERLARIRSAEEEITALRRETAAATVRSELEGIEEPYVRRGALIEQDYRAAVEAAEAKANAERDRVEREIEDEEQKAAEIRRINAQLQADLADAEHERIREIRDAEAEAAEEAQRLYEERVRALENYTRVVARSLADSLFGSQRYTEAELELTQWRYDEEQRRLDESLRRQQISHEEYNLRIRRLDEQRAEFSKAAEADRAGFLERTIRGLVDVAIEEGERQLAAFIAQQIAKLVFGQSATAATVVAQVAAGKAIAAAYAPAAAAASIATFGASAAAGQAAALTAIASITGAIAALNAFEEGGYTGQGRRDEPAGVVHRGEFVLTKRATERAGVGTLYALMEALEKGHLKRNDLGELLDELNLSVSVPITRKQLLMAAGFPVALPGYEGGGFVSLESLALNLTPALTLPSSRAAAAIDLSPLLAEQRRNNEEVRKLRRELAEREMHVDLSASKRTAAQLTRTGGEYLDRKRVSNRLRRRRR